MTPIVWLIRHGETESNRMHILQGVLDVPLNARGRWQAEQLGKRMISIKSTIYSSTLSRARETADCIGGVVLLDARLREFDSGVFAGLSQAQAKASFPVEWARYHADSSFVVPGGESYDAFCGRVCAAFEDITTAVGATAVCIVAHGGVLDCIKNRYLTASSSSSLVTRTRCGNASLSKLVYSEEEEEWEAVMWNDTQHLEGSEEVGGADDVR